VVIWYLFTHLGKLRQEKSGNPAIDGLVLKETIV
jgi:hypothetical protein